MKIIVDTNAVFSALLKPESNIGQILINGFKFFDFISTDLLRIEIDRHKDKVLKYSKLSSVDFELVRTLVYSRIRFVNEALLSDEDLKTAYKYTFDVDSDDTVFVGLAIKFKCKLWTGDKELINGLINKGFGQFISTQEIFQIYLENQYKRGHRKSRK